MRNAGDYKHKIQIVEIRQGKDADGFPAPQEEIIWTAYAKIKTTRGFTLIANNSDFEKALTNFTIRYSKTVVSRYVESNRDLQVKFNGKNYTIEYLNNIDEANVELEIQAKVVVK